MFERSTRRRAGLFGAPRDIAGPGSALLTHLAVLPPGLPQPEHIDVQGARTILASAAAAYGEMGYPTPTTPLRPMEPEDAAGHIHAVQQGHASTWRDTVKPLQPALIEKLDGEATRLTEKIAEHDDEAETLNHDLAEHVESTSERSRRYEKVPPAALLVVLVILMIAEFPIINPILGRLYDLAGQRQDLASFATLVVNELVCGLAGAAIARWLGYEGPRRHRLLAAAGGALGVLVSIAFIVGLTLARASNAAAGDVLAGLTLFAGVQAGINLAAFMIGYTLHNPAVADGRAMRKQKNDLAERQDTAHAALHATTAEAEHLRGFDIDHWMAEYRCIIRDLFMVEINLFRAELIRILGNAGHHHSVEVVALMPLPELTLPAGHDETDGAELNPGPFVMTFW